LELDEAYDEHGQTMYRTHLKDLIILKRKQTEEKPEKKVDEMEDLTTIDQFEVGKVYMLFVKKKTHVEPTSAKIIKISEEGVRCFLTHKGVTKKVTVTMDKFLKQYRRAYDGFKNADVTVRRPTKKEVVEEVFDWS
jgi:hypothetical protein